MLIAVCSLKGGVAKTTTAVHIAAALASSTKGRVLLLDADASRAATRWAGRGAGLPFAVHPLAGAGDRAGVAHTVVDTPGAENAGDLLDLARLADCVVIPTPPLPLDLVGALDTLALLEGVANTRVLLTRCPPARQRDEANARELLTSEGAHVLRSTVPNRKAYQLAALLGATVRETPDGSTLWPVWPKIAKEVTT